MSKHIKRFKAVIEQHNPDLTVEHAKGGHYHVKLSGKYITSVTHSGQATSYQNSLADLVRANLLPQECKRIKF